MGEIHGRLLIGGMVLRNLEVSLDRGAADTDSGWTGVMSIDPPQQECLQLGRPYRLELDDERAAQIELTHIECIPGQSRLRVHIRGCSPLKWSPYAHEYRHESAVIPLPVNVFGEA